MISILMPVYNAAPYLDECIRSIIAQSNTNWELIAINDFSEDESQTILETFAKQDSRISTYQNKEKGIIPALRIAFAKSKGALITRMDADDIMPPSKLEVMSQACRPGAVVTGRVEYFKSDGDLGDGYRRYADWLNGLVETRTHWQEIYKECVIPSPAWMMERETFERIGAFNSDIYPEDYNLAFSMYGAGLEAIGVDSLVHHWRDHGERASRNELQYSDNRFLDLKLNRFIEIDLNPNCTLALWGAGRKGKYCAQWLVKLGYPFTWHTDNPKKQEVDIYGVVLKSPSEMASNAQCLLTMASPKEQVEVANWLEGRKDIDSYWLA